ncbi:MAG: hypothetical protein JW860_13280 [Sedimentisphaerales bacterium]|nr:hypothetical protein [Sedimentisphaerales bacterium]
MFITGVLPADVSVWGDSDKSDSRPFYFKATADMPAGTVAHSAVVLANGDVLVTGGYGKLFGKLPVATNLARIYDHKQNAWRITKNPMNVGRFSHASIRLDSGKVLIVGGRGQNGSWLNSVEIFDPEAEMFILLGNMRYARKNPCLNLLPDGRVLVTGCNQLTEIIEPAPQEPQNYRIREAKGKSIYNHTDHATVTLGDGSVLLIGGRANLMERFDPETETFSLSAAKLPAFYDDQAAMLLYTGNVFLAGAQNILNGTCVDRTWIYDYKTDRLMDGPRLKPTARGKTPIGVSDIRSLDLFSFDEEHKGRFFLLCGGEDDPGTKNGADIDLDSAWIYDAMGNRIIDVGPMIHAHDDFDIAALGVEDTKVKVLIIAGHGPEDSFQAACEIFYADMNYLLGIDHENSHSP